MVTDSVFKTQAIFHKELSQMMFQRAFQSVISGLLPRPVLRLHIAEVTDCPKLSIMPTSCHKSARQLIKTTNKLITITQLVIHSKAWMLYSKNRYWWTRTSVLHINIVSVTLIGSCTRLKIDYFALLILKYSIKAVKTRFTLITLHYLSNLKTFLIFLTVIDMLHW